MSSLTLSRAQPPFSHQGGHFLAISDLGLAFCPFRRTSAFLFGCPALKKKDLSIHIRLVLKAFCGVAKSAIFFLVWLLVKWRYKLYFVF